jgi:hypothetical protein
MNIYYIDSKRVKKYNIQNVASLGDRTIQQLTSEISRTPNFCREESSIKVSELIGYLNDGITLYTLNAGNLSGVINFDINVDKLNIMGLCAPGPSVGAGTQLINAVKIFAELNGIKNIKLTCYGDVVNFYTNNGFRIQNQGTINYDSDYDSDSEDESESVIKYDMVYTVVSGGKRRNIKTRNIKTRNIKTRNIKTRNIKTRNIKTRNIKTRKIKTRKDKKKNRK